jgi:ribosome biogenesis GTPase / thiamine phosphate phosphatase
MQPSTHAFKNLQGIVYKKTIGNYVVHAGERVITCSISSRLRKELIYPIADPGSLSHIVRGVDSIKTVDPVAVGDIVRFVDTQDGSGLIVEVLPRRNRLSRINPGTKRLEQVVVANLDQVVPIFAAVQPEPKWNLLDRYLASAESLGLASMICITKMDLLDGDMHLLDEVETYRKIGYPVILTSVASGLGLDDLRAALRGRLSVFIGKSGVGKTSLLNALQPGLGLRVNEVSQATEKGKHTTSNLAMFPLDIGGSVVDTPGMREFGLWNVNEDDLALLFPEMRALVGTCRFGMGCAHTHEPGCSIRKAVEDGQVNTRRYQSYLRLREE